jgi:glutamyl-tRNA synthetase
MKEIRVRFAPSPTGELHLGGARTALFNWLFAKNKGGKFLVRIEDTDKTRSTEKSTFSILKALEWLGLQPEEEIIYQSQRIGLYKEHLLKLLKNGQAYKCYCSEERLKQMRHQALKQGKKPKYDGRCRNRSSPLDSPYVIRFKTPQQGKITFHDLIKGEITIANEELDDLIIARQDGRPTYNLCVVVDDVMMKITHVIRGEDHLNNTPRQIHIYRALNYKEPLFAHLPLIHGLSKRAGSTSIHTYKNEGYLKEAVINYIVRLGWSYGDEEIFSVKELINKFSLEAVGRSSAKLNPEKLLWLNKHYMKTLPLDIIASQSLLFFKNQGLEPAFDDRFKKIISLLRVRAKTLKELPNLASYFYLKEISYDKEVKEKFLTPRQTKYFPQIIRLLTKIDPFDETSIKKGFDKFLADHNLTLKHIAQPLRVALTGRTKTPGLFEVISLLGKDVSIKRLSKHLNFTS